MKISELPKGLKELAEIRRKEHHIKVYGYVFNKTTDEVNSAFSWRGTIEGFDFWNEVDKGNFDIYYSGIIKLEDIPVNYQVVKEETQLDRIEKLLIDIWKQKK